MARKVFAQKKHVQGLEAPRTSLNLQIEALDRCAMREHTQFYGLDKFRSERMRNQHDASMKKLIKDEISSRSTNSNRRRSPSVVARLMGMDVLPEDSSPVTSTNVKEKESMRSDLSRRKNLISSGMTAHNPSNSEPGIRKNNQKEERTWRREHPQEEELQKFKKEFEAWQAARFRECSQFVNLDPIPSWSGAREKPSHAIAILKPSERDYTDNFGAAFPQKNGGSSFPMRNFENTSMDRSHATISGDKCDDFLHPTRIVILKPGSDNNIWSNDESLTSSSGSDERGSSMEDFLHEVKERLRRELQGKALKKSSVVRGSGIETPFREKPSYSKEVAQNITNQAKDSIARDIEEDLHRSGSTRSFRSKMYLTEPWSPEFIHGDTRRFLLERLRNVTKGERYSELPEECLDGSTSHFIDYQWDENARRRRNYPKNVDKEHEIQVRSFRHGSSNNISIQKELSPRNLVRSMSAPVSGTPFGKLLLEDRHILTGAHIRRKQEACESQPRDSKKTRREKFNFKERIHNIKYTFTLRRKLFGKRIPSIKGSRICEPDFFKDMSSGPTDFFKDMSSGPTVLTNFGERFENSTEVPPSPASVCSSTQDEYWRPSSNLSPISTPGLSLAEDDAVPGVFREISMNLNELRRQLNQLGSSEPIGTPDERRTTEPEMPELDDKVESYIRDLLVASGWYDGSLELCLLKWDSLSKPISDLAFKDVEESYRNLAKDDNIPDNGKVEKATKIDRRLLHNLINEVLPSILSPAKSKNACFAPLVIPRGSDLLCAIWEIVRELIYPKADESCYSSEIMASWDKESNMWMGLLDEQVPILCREMEALIVEELVEEILKEMG